MAAVLDLQAPLAPAAVRYIKLGAEGAAAADCFAAGFLALRFAYIARTRRQPRLSYA